MQFPSQSVARPDLLSPGGRLGSAGLPPTAFVEWDQAYLLRRLAGASFADTAAALRQAEERGYNACRIDPMPQWIDLAQPDVTLDWHQQPYAFNPWGWTDAVSGPGGRWLCEFVDQLLESSSLSYSLSAWWYGYADEGGPARLPSSHMEAAEIWADQLAVWRQRFGTERLLFVDLANELPFFTPPIMTRLLADLGTSTWSGTRRWTNEQIDILCDELNPPVAALQREFPDIRFGYSVHGDPRWLDVPLTCDVIDVHFYADADPRWTARTRFDERLPSVLTSSEWFEDFDDRARKAWELTGAGLRARQRAVMAAFADWSGRLGMPIVATEGFATWYLIDHPDLSWDWVRRWAESAVDDARDLGFAGWTPHNYTQPHFEDWSDVAWHRSMTDRFLAGERSL